MHALELSLLHATPMGGSVQGIFASRPPPSSKRPPSRLPESETQPRPGPALTNG